jgi:hypothetical protein
MRAEGSAHLKMKYQSWTLPILDVADPGGGHAGCRSVERCKRPNCGYLFFYGDRHGGELRFLFATGHRDDYTLRADYDNRYRWEHRIEFIRFRDYV